MKSAEEFRFLDFFVAALVAMHVVFRYHEASCITGYAAFYDKLMVLACNLVTTNFVLSRKTTPKSVHFGQNICSEASFTRQL